MSKTLVVGATGQVGTAVVKKLLGQGQPVRALVRNSDSETTFRNLGADAAIGDLTDASSLRLACEGVTAVVATANAAIPSKSTDSFQAVEQQGYRNLIRAATEARVERFVYTSVLRSKHEGRSEFFRFKRETEGRIIQSFPNHVIFRAAPFMETAFTMMGSTIPLEGAEAATVLRPFRFAANYFQRIKDSIERKRTAMIPGDGSVRHSFICVDNVAAFLTASVSGGSPGIPPGFYDIGGPDALSFLDVVHLYEGVLGFGLCVKRTPAWVFRIAETILKPFSPAGSNLMFFNYVAATEHSVMDMAKTAALFQVQLTSAESFLRNKHSMAIAAAS